MTIKQIILIYLIAINVVAFFLYGIDKWKAKRSKWRISEATLLGFDNIVGGYQFKYGIPLILMAQIAIVLLTSCKTKQTVELSAPVLEYQIEQEHSPNVFLVMYDEKVGNTPLQKAIKAYGCEVIYDYNIINGMALKKPDAKTLEETMQYFKGVKGVLTVEYDHIIRLTDPIKPRLETR